MTPETEINHIKVYIQWLERVEERLDVLCTLQPYEDHPVPKAAARIAEAKELLQGHLDKLAKEVHPADIPNLHDKLIATIVSRMREGHDLLRYTDNYIALYLVTHDESYEDMDVHYLAKIITRVRAKLHV